MAGTKRLNDVWSDYPGCGFGRFRRRRAGDASAFAGCKELSRLSARLGGFGVVRRLLMHFRLISLFNDTPLETLTCLRVLGVNPPLTVRSVEYVMDCCLQFIARASPGAVCSLTSVQVPVERGVADPKQKYCKAGRVAASVRYFGPLTPCPGVPWDRALPPTGSERVLYPFEPTFASLRRVLMPLDVAQLCELRSDRFDFCLVVDIQYAVRTSRGMFTMGDICYRYNQRSGI